ncbi:MAG TPA: TetR/AcrR family transcriptional regulator [Longimicrobiales bacterium]|nr:TetR/AcrR family transcriptional regulator [Longimicrobiales bacterium]
MDGPTKPAPQGPRPSGRGEDTRTALLEAARLTFARNGYDGSSIRAITGEAGTNLGAVSYHFGSKRALYAEVLRRGLTPMVDRVGEAAASEGRPLERLTRVVSVFFDHLATHADVPRLLLQEVSAGRKPPAEVVAIIQRNATYVQGIIAEGWADGSIRRSHPLFSALSVAALPIYMTVMAPLIREVAGVDLLDAATRQLAAEHVQAFVRNGLAAPQEARA